MSQTEDEQQGRKEGQVTFVRAGMPELYDNVKKTPKPKKGKKGK